MIRFLTLLLPLFLAASAYGTLVVIDLPELTGDYNLGDNLPGTAPSQRSTNFTIPDDIENLQELRLAITGEWTQGRVAFGREVGGVTYWDTLDYYLDLAVVLTSDALGDCVFHAATRPWGGPFDRNEIFLDYCPTGQAYVNQLLGADITAELFCDHDLNDGVVIVEDFHGTVTSVRLEAVGAVPTRKVSWGTIKAQYH